MAQNPYVTPDIINLFLLDRGPGDNFLLEEKDMPPELMSLSMQLAVDRYNTTSPIGLDPQTIDSFPYRYELLLGTTANLLRSKALNMIRNRINYQTAAGVTVDEKSMADAYLQLADKFSAEFEQRITAIKVNANQRAGYGALDSPFILTNSYW